MGEIDAARLAGIMAAKNAEIASAAANAKGQQVGAGNTIELR